MVWMNYQLLQRFYAFLKVGTMIGKSFPDSVQGSKRLKKREDAGIIINGNGPHHFWSQDPYNRYVVLVLGSIQKFCLKIAKIENCQNWKLLGLKVVKL